MKKLIISLLLCTSISAFAFQDLCELTPGSWKGWLKTDFIKWKARGRIEHVSGNNYLVSGSVPDLGLKGTYRYTCANGVAHHSSLKKPVYFKRSGSSVKVDYTQGKYKGHFEHRIGGLTLFEKLRSIMG